MFETENSTGSIPCSFYNFANNWFQFLHLNDLKCTSNVPLPRFQALKRIGECWIEKPSLDSTSRNRFLQPVSIKKYSRLYLEKGDFLAQASTVFRVKFKINAKTDHALPCIPVGNDMQQPCKICKCKWAVLTARFAVCTVCTFNADQRER